MSQTFFLIKPHANAQAPDIIKMIEENDYVIHCRMEFDSDPEVIKKHCAEHEGRAYYDGLVKSLEGPCVAALADSTRDESHDEAVARFRKLIGATDPSKAEEGTIRAKFGRELPFNAIHASDCVAAVEIESHNWFGIDD